jgi:rSAM/selenodomain-associated transferase 1
MGNETVICIMAKKPQPGQTKTRLCPALSPQGAAALSEALVLDTIALAAGLHWADLAIAVSPPGSEEYFRSLTQSGTFLLPVEGKDIGECLVLVMERLLTMGFRKAMALNSDGPSLPPEYLMLADGYLEDADIVLGPGHDGGYYLVGMTRLHAEIFSEIEWSTARVLSQTLERASKLGLRTALTPQWYDVDTPADLIRLQAELTELPTDRLANCRRFITVNRLSPTEY